MLYLLRWKKFRGTPTALSNLFDDLIGKFIQIFRRRCAFSYRLDISLPSYFQLSPRLSALGRISRSPRGPSLREEEKGINFSRRFPTNVSYNCEFTFHREELARLYFKTACIGQMYSKSGNARDHECCWHDATRRGVESRRALSLRHLARPPIHALCI